MVITIKAFIYALKLKLTNKRFYRKLLAYGCIIGGMKYNDAGSSVEDWKTNDNFWVDELPTIYNLDSIVDEMNNQHDDINKTFKLKIDVWTRDEVRALMDAFEMVHNGFSKVNNRKFTIMETCAKIMNWIDSSFWYHFNAYKGEDLKE